jgi:hypothetical protein
LGIEHEDEFTWHSLARVVDRIEPQSKAKNRLTGFAGPDMP